MTSNDSAERYVKKVSANPEMSHRKILDRIRSGSSVLEFGPASGAMTEVLSQDMDCKVSIVEIDQACYTHALQFAQDGVCADIESYTWETAFEGKQFDVIVLADVLEHLLHPEEVLRHIHRFVKDDGSVLISVPNIAHNSVIIQLLQNQFIYQSTGILDHTHVHMFTFSELQKTCRAAGYEPIYLDAVYIGVGKNEFPDSYADIDPMIAAYLKKRPLGEVYQHILEIKKAAFVEENHIRIDNRLGSPAVYTNALLEDLKMNAKGSHRDEVLRILSENPNIFFESNNEIARLRLEINDLYNSNSNADDALIAFQRISALHEEVKGKNRFARKLQAEIEEKDVRIVQLQEEEDARNQHIACLDAEIKTLTEQHVQTTTARQENQELRQKSDQLTEKCAAMLQENQELRQKNNQLTEKCTAMLQENQQLIQEVRNKNGHIELLLESEREFERYKQTRAYRSTLRRRKIIDTILPPNSKRLFILHVLKKMVTQPRLMAQVVRPSYIGNYIKYLSSDSIEEIKNRYNEIESVAKGEGPAAALVEQPALEAVKQGKTEPQSIEDLEMLCFAAEEAPVVSIVIPVYNQFGYTYACLKSILQNSGDVPYEIIIANDCSTDLTTEIESVVKNIQVITTPQNLRFLLNCNNAAKYARGQYILFLNNDTQVQPDWLRPLVDVMERDASVGMVGSKLIYPDGRLQEAGGIVWKDASAWNYGHLKDPADPEFNYLKEADYVSGAAIMIRTDLWKQIGGFDERFAPAYYEDTDLAFEVRRHGFKVMMQPKSVVVHFEGVSNGTDTSSGLKAYQTANLTKFREKWKDVLEKEHFENGQNVYLAKDRGQIKKQILVVDHYVPNYDKDAGGRCTYMYLKMFLKMGLKVTFIGDNFAHPEPYTSELNALGVEILYGNYYYNNWQNWLKENLHYFDYIYLQRPHISIKYIDIVKKYARGKIFYFAHDLHHVRMYRDYELTGDAKALEESMRWKKIEMELFEKADVCHVVGSYEQGVMQKAFPDKPIRNIPLYIYDSLPEQIEKDFSKRRNILFVGGFGHDPNIDAVLWFAQNVYPKILEKYPDMVWHIVGSKAPNEVKKLAGPNIVLDGFVSDERLAELYDQCRLAVVPLRYGAGVKGKVVEASYYQIPLVTTTIGGEGLDSAFGSFVMEDDADKMAQIVCDLYMDFGRLSAMSDAGAKFIETYFTPKIAENVLAQDM